MCDSFDEFEKLFCEKETWWSEAFGDYFRSRILTKVDDYGI